jgi:hypothetical protein
MASVDWKQAFFVLEIILAVIALIGSIYGFVKFIDSRIKKKLKDSEFVKHVIQLLRPYAIFNEKGEIIVDRGALSFIEDIEILLSEKEKLPQKITIKLKEHNATAPILLSLDNDMCTIKESRGKKFEWLYNIEYHGWNEKDERRFNIEIVT